MTRNRTKDTTTSAVAPASPSPGLTAAALAVTAAAWVGAGSVALLAHPLRLGLVLLLMSLSAVAAWPATPLPRRHLLTLVLGACAGLLALAQGLPWLTVALLPILPAVLAEGHDGAARRVLTVAARVLAVFAVYQLLMVSVAPLWLGCARLTGALSAIAGRLAGQPLRVGPTFGGVDGLVLMAAWYGLWLGATQPPRAGRALGGLLAVALAQLAYLAILAQAPRWLALLPAAAEGAAQPFWPAVARQWIPWNLPACGLLLHGAVLAGMLRWSAWEPLPAPAPARGRRDWAVAGLAGALACLLAFTTTHSVGQAALVGKRIVFHEKGFLNWLKPEHGDYGRLSIGMYGLLPHYVRSLGATCVVSPDLAAADLDKCDILVLIYPNEPWTPDQLQRILDFVRAGGSLWLLGEHTVREADGGNRFNDILTNTHMRVAYDCAEFAIGGWLHSYTLLAHPATLALEDDRNQAGIVVGASVEARWPARPVVVGRWGWSDHGDPGGNAMIGNAQPDAGEQLGDVVLAAEQRFGKGRILVFGDTSTLSNGINMGSHAFTARVLAYLAGSVSGPNTPWRETLGVLAGLALAALLLAGLPPATLAAVLVLLAGVGWGLTRQAEARLKCFPSRDRLGAYRLAYLDAGHLGLQSPESWRNEGTMGLSLNLMRNGFLTLQLPENHFEALREADVFVSIAPMRAYTAAERAVLRQFVNGGGVFILTVGYGDHAPVRDILAEYGFDLDALPENGPRTLREPQPLGFFKAPYYNGGSYMAHVRFHAAWPIQARAEPNQPIAFGAGNTTVALMRKIGDGKVLVVADSCFAMNKNLEVESGQAFEGMRENPYFWRWLLAYLCDRPAWTPPDPEAERPPAPAPGEEVAP